MITTTLLTCATCPCWIRGKRLTNGQELPGQCRFNPPTATPTGTRWAATEAGDWCWQHPKLHAPLPAAAGPGFVPGSAAQTEAKKPLETTTRDTALAAAAPETGHPAVPETGGEPATDSAGGQTAPAEATHKSQPQRPQQRRR